jgi:ATP-dependent Clp protease adaptor protein ClpS
MANSPHRRRGVVVASLQPLRSPDLVTTTSTTTTDETDRPWNVVVWNDPVTPMQVVVVVFKKVFGYADNKATALMLTVHHEGRAVVWSGAVDRAQTYCVKLQVAGLMATIEQES